MGSLIKELLRLGAKGLREIAPWLLCGMPLCIRSSDRLVSIQTMRKYDVDVRPRLDRRDDSRR
jgi:hypothetical protein